MRVLYISYDGLMEPLGQSQILPYLRELARVHPITLVSYEKPEDWVDRSRRQALIDRVRAAGIRWRPLRYHKWPTLPATAYDLVVGLVLSMWLIWRYRIQIIHARSYVPSLLALILKRVWGTRFIFDMRGFWADERLDGGIWTQDSFLYRLAKWFERQFLAGADVVVTLTQAAVAVLSQSPHLVIPPPRLEVVTTCTDLELFRPVSRAHPLPKGSGQTFTLGYVGSVNGWGLFDLVLACFNSLLAQDPEAQLVILNHGQQSLIRQRLAAHGIPAPAVHIKAVEHERVASEMGRMDAGLFFYKLVPSSAARAPTKLGEFLACGVPCLSNAGIGDTSQLLESERVGIVLRSFNRAEQQEAVRRIWELAAEPGIRERCAGVAHRYFSLADGVRAYDRIYLNLDGKGAERG